MSVETLSSVALREVVERLAAVPGREERLTHLEVLPARAAVEADWPEWVPDDVRVAFEARGSADPVAAPGRGRRGGSRRPSRGDGHRHRLGQVAGLPAADPDSHPLDARPAAAAGRGDALPQPDQGPRPGPAGRPRVAGPRRPVRHPRRRQPPGAAGVDARPRRVRPDQPRHAPPLAASCSPPLVPLPGVAALRRGRRVPPLPRRVRRPRGAGAASVAARVRGVRRPPDVRARLGHRGRAGGSRPPADRPRRAPGRRRRLAARPGGHRAVGATVHVLRGRARRARASRGLVRDRRPARRPGRRGSADPRLHPVAARGRAGRADRGRAARRRRPGTRRPGGRLPRRLPARGAARHRASAPFGRAHRVGRDQRPRARHRHQRSRRRADGGLPRHPRRHVAAGRPGRPWSRRRPRRAGRPRRPARHLPGDPPRVALRQAGRGHGHRPHQRAHPRAPPVRGRPGDPADGGRRADVRADGARDPRPARR